MQKKSFFSTIVNAFVATPVRSTVAQQAMTPLSKSDVQAVAGGPQVINRPT